ncbi:MAG: hypothetical protein JKY43_06865 [Phycisphaerales bacterium]|nr:hypothetical protein [Phycisphaerales bacterium]
MRTKTISPIGLDLDYNEFRAIQFDTSASPEPIAVATIPRTGRRQITPSSDELTKLTQTLYQRGFVGDQVALAVPKEYSSFHILDLPPEGSGAPINHLALLEAQRAGTHKTEDLQIGYWTQRPKDPPSKFPSPYYTIACETEPLDQLIDTFESACLTPISIEPIETALARAATMHEEFIEDAIHSIIEIGWDHSWAIITLGSIPVYTRRIDCGATRIRRQLIDDHAMPVHAINNLLNPPSPSQNPDSKVDRIIATILTPMLTQIVDQLDIALTYVSQQHRFAPFGVVLRSGYFSNLNQTAHAIAQRTGMPSIRLSAMQSGELQVRSSISPFELALSPRLNIAAGLALGAAA